MPFVTITQERLNYLEDCERALLDMSDHPGPDCGCVDCDGPYQPAPDEYDSVQEQDFEDMNAACIDIGYRIEGIPQEDGSL